MDQEQGKTKLPKVNVHDAEIWLRNVLTGEQGYEGVTCYPKQGIIIVAKGKNDVFEAGLGLVGWEKRAGNDVVTLYRFFTDTRFTEDDKT